MADTENGEYRETQVSDVIDLLKLTIDYADMQFFRGQSKVCWPLTPRIARLFDGSTVPADWTSIEYEILEEFRRYAFPLIDTEPKSNAEWMALGQHYGLPTRILDWTSNPLKAAFFAVNEWPNEDGAVFRLKSRTIVTELGERESFNGEVCLVPFLPKMLDVRFVAQEARFTAFPLPDGSNSFKPLEDLATYGREYWLLEKMVIPKDKKLVMLRELNGLGINSRTLFPDLTGLSSYVEWKLCSEDKG